MTEFFLYLLSFFASAQPFHHSPLETRQKIAIIDTGIRLTDKTKKYLCYGEHFDVTGKGIWDVDGHGTNIAGIISKNIDTTKKCLLIIKYYHSFSSSASNVLKSLKIATKENVSFINFSSGGEGESEREREFLLEFLKKNIHVSVAAGNDGQKLTKTDCNYYPACYNFQSSYFHVIGNGISENERRESSNYGPIVTDWRSGIEVEGFGIRMTGSSQSTAVFTGELIK